MAGHPILFAEVCTNDGTVLDFRWLDSYFMLSFLWILSAVVSIHVPGERVLPLLSSAAIYYDHFRQDVREDFGVHFLLLKVYCVSEEICGSLGKTRVFPSDPRARRKECCQENMEGMR